MKFSASFKVLPLSLLLIASGSASMAKENGSEKSGPEIQPATLECLQPIAESEWDYEKARHLLSRAGFSGAPDEVAKLHAMGLNGAVNFLVDFEKLPEFITPFEIDRPQATKYPEGVAKESDEARKIRQVAMKAERKKFSELRAWWIRRMALSNRPLEEKLTLFWHGLLVSGYRTVNESYAMYQQNQLYRKHAAGNYGDLLLGLIHDPAMLRYLDNNTNVRGRPNENLAREILELFSMGEGLGYTEEDIKEAARALTGNVYDRQANFVFQKKKHDNEKKTIFGETGNFDGDDLVDLILKQPAPSRYIAGKLHSYFAYDNGSTEVVENLANIFRQNHYEMKPLLRTLFLSRDFYSEKALGTQIKSPVSLVVGTIRTLEIKVDDFDAIAKILISMEQELFEPPNVKGWDGGQAWMNTTTLFNRQNFAGSVEALLRKTGSKGNAKKPGRPGGGSVVVDRLQLLDFQNSADVVDFMAKTLFVLDIAPEHHQSLITFLDEGTPFPPSSQWKSTTGANPKANSARASQIDRKLMALLVLMMSMPEFQMN